MCEHKNCVRRKVSKHKEIKGSDKIVTLNISAKFDSLNKMETTSSESKVKLGRSGKGLVTNMAFNTKVRFSKCKKVRYTVGNVSEKDILKIIKEFEEIGKLHYEKRIPKHDPTSSYFNLVRQPTKCMMRSDEQNRNVHGNYAEETAPSLNVNVTDKDESKEIIVHNTFYENSYLDVGELERNI